MKKTAHSIALLFFLLLLINTSHLLARFLESKQGEEVLKKQNEITTEAYYLAEREENDSLDQLMGLDDCKNGDDEECAKRRMVAEAHLDYIYTQHLKP